MISLLSDARHGLRVLLRNPGFAVLAILALALGIGRMVVAGLIVVLAKLPSAFLFGVSPTDPFTFAVAVLLMLSTALATCLVPAVRASRVDPIQTLRSE